MRITVYLVREDKSRRLRLTSHVVRTEERCSDRKVLSGKPTGKRILGMPRRRWEDNITRMDLRVICINTRKWVDSAQDRNCWR